MDVSPDGETRLPVAVDSLPPTPTQPGSRLSAMAKPHSRELGARIAGDYRLLNYLRGRSTDTVAAIPPGSTRIDVEGGVLASRCEEDHDEVLECWYFYKRAGKPN